MTEPNSNRRALEASITTSGSLVYSVPELARVLRLSKNSIYQAILRGELPYVKIGKRILVPKVQLDRLLSGDSETKQVHDG